MEPSKLKNYNFKKGKFIAPLNEFVSEMDENKSWMYGRMPEYLWIGMVLHHYGRKEGLNKLYHIVKYIGDNLPEMRTLRMSEILSLDVDKQKKLYEYMNLYIEEIALSPLTVIFTINI